MDDKMEARLRDEVIVAGYEALPDVYEWLIPDAKLTPEGSVAALGDLVQCLPSNARVLDCSSGTGQLAIGLARLGFDVVATDASAGMVCRTQELADEHSVPLQALRVAWDDLPDYLDPSTFDLVICVGNSLCHAQGTSGRLAALAAMSRLLNPRGRLVLTSRTWELVRAGGTRIDVRDRLVGRRGHDAVVIYSWQIEHLWEQEPASPRDRCRTGRARRNCPDEFGAVVLLAVPVRGTRGGTAKRRTRDSGEHLRP